MKIFKLIVIWIIRFYQTALSPFLGSRCRFYPTCSSYAIKCFRKFPFFVAMRYSIYRIVRCHPFNAGGYDPVP